MENKTKQRAERQITISRKKNAVGIIKGYILCLGIDNREWSFIIGRIGLSPLRHCGTEHTFLFTLIWEIILFCFLQTFKHVIGTICRTCHHNTVSWHDDNTVSWHRQHSVVTWRQHSVVTWRQHSVVTWRQHIVVTWRQQCRDMTTTQCRDMTTTQCRDMTTTQCRGMYNILRECANIGRNLGPVSI